MKASRKDLDLTQFSAWYPLLSKQSIKSVTIDLDESFIQYLRQDSVKLPRSLQGYLEPSKSESYDDFEVSKISVEENEEDGDLIEGFPELENAISNVFADFTEVFPKLNWSAPSDAIWMNNGTLKCRSIAEVFLLIKSSDRISFDLDNMYDHCGDSGPTQPFQPQLTLRKWANLNPCNEYRVFVHHNFIIAICQRDCTSYYPFLINTIKEVQEKIEEFFKSSIRDCMDISSYVLDVYIDRKKRLWVVDVNAFGDPTCPLLFEWADLLNMIPGGDVTVRLVNSDAERMNSVAGMKRGPVDVFMAPDFGNFMEICKKQNAESDDEVDK